MTALASRRGVLPALSLLAGFALWELAGRAGISSALPPFSDVLAAIGEEWTSAAFWSATATTLAAIALGLPIAIGLGIVVGVIMGMLRVVAWLLSPYVAMFLSVPLTALVPVLLLVFGLTRTAVIVAIFVYTFFVVALSTQAGVENVDRGLLDMARSFRARRTLVIRRIVLPSALGITLAGVRIAVGRAVKGAIVTEQIIGLLGLGGRVQRLGGAFAVEELYAVVLFIGLLGLGSMELVRLVERSHGQARVS
ncbi:MAG: ABC transporter permease subunit [Nitriliruptorales bacterium]|nr:ABC transporter permease subunit [Nitriliruptorales bacterium]